MLSAAVLFAVLPLTIPGESFEGGAAARFGGEFFGRRVNYVYAASNGPLAAMSASFEIATLPKSPTLYLKARDDEAEGSCRIEIALNGQTVFRGPSGFSGASWQTRAFPAPSLREGSNLLEIRNLELKGEPGMPPWFMVAQATIAGADEPMTPDLSKDFSFELPGRKRPLPEPGSRPGFVFRGIKGWLWKPQDYLDVVPVMKAHGMNFLMNCYTNMADVEHYRWGDPKANRWWEPLPPEKKAWLARLAAECRKNGIEFCFSMNPNLNSQRPLRYDSQEDLEALWAHYAWMQSQGVRWFNVSLDDISEGIDGEGQVRVVNEIHRRLVEKDPSAKLIFCPTWYWGDGTEKDKRPYLETLAKSLHPDVYLFWTGRDVLGPIRRADAESYRAAVRHRLFVWDNYPVNDANPTMHLGPVVNRDRDLCEAADGYMSNSMSQQAEINRIPMLTCADYAANPWDYDPARSVGQAILHLASKDSERKLLRDLVMAYPGFLVYYEGKYITDHNPARERFSQILKDRHPRFLAELYLQKMEDLLRRMQKTFPTRYPAAKATLESDVAWMQAELAERYGGAR
jgi:hypothetical protein